MGIGIGSSVDRFVGSTEDREEFAATTRAAVELHIEELVLHGFPASDRFRIGDAVEQELSRLIAERGLGLAANPVSIGRLDAGAFKVPTNARPQAIGAQLAQQVYQQLSPKPKRPVAHGRSRETRAKR